MFFFAMLFKKLIVTAHVSELNEADFVTDAKAKVKAMTDNSTIVPTPDPLTSVVKTEVDNMADEIVKRDLCILPRKQRLRWL